MLPFYIRFLLTLSVWMFILLAQKESPSVEILFFCSIYLAVYFLIPILKYTLYWVFLLTFTPLLYIVIIDSSMFNYLLLVVLLYLFESAYFIEPLKYRIVSGSLIVGFFITTLLVGSESILATTSLYFLLIVITLLYVNFHFFTIKDKDELYEEVLAEYRKMKRQALQNEKIVRTEERTRIARDMHDSVGHKLTALSIQLEMLLIKKREKALENMKETVDACLEETRKAVRALKMDNIGGITSVIQLVKKLEAESHMMVNLTTKKGVLGSNLSNHNSIILYRVLQESLTNAMKYGDSREVFVTLGLSAIGDLHFTVKNVYHNQSSQIHEGFGLKNMRLRVEEVGGRLDIYQNNHFFIIEGFIPLEEGRNDSHSIS